MAVEIKNGKKTFIITKEELAKFKSEKDEMKKHAKKWYAMGIAKTEIARMLGRDEKTIRVWLKEDVVRADREYEKKKKEQRANKIQSCVKMIDSGCTDAAIAKALSFTIEKVKALRKTLKKS